MRQSGRERFGSKRRAREQPAAADADEQHVEGADLLDQLLGGGALSGDDVRVVVGRDEGEPAFLGQLEPDGLAVLLVAVVENDLAAIALGCRDLHRGGVLRHDDDGRDLLQLPGIGDGLGVIAGGKRHDAEPLRLGGEPGDGVVGTAEFEGAAALKVLGLEEQGAARAFVGGAGGEHRRAMGDAVDALGRGGDILVGRQLRCGLGWGLQGHRSLAPFEPRETRALFYAQGRASGLSIAIRGVPCHILSTMIAA